MKKQILFQILFLVVVLSTTAQVKIKAHITDLDDYTSAKISVYKNDALVYSKKGRKLNYKLDKNSDYKIIVEKPGQSKMINISTYQVDKKINFEFIVVMDKKINNLGGMVYYNNSKKEFEYAILN
jgi:hypothetical protein